MSMSTVRGGCLVTRRPRSMASAVGGVALLFFIGGGASRAADTAWVGGTSGAWTTSGNWSAGVPTAGDNAQLLGGSATVISLTGTTLQANQLQVWSGATYELVGSGTATLALGDQLYVFSDPTASSLKLSGPLLVTSPNGSLGTGGGDVGSTLRVGGGGASLQIANEFNVGYDGANSLLEVQGGGSVQAAQLVVGNLATATSHDLSMSGGAVTATTGLIVGNLGGGNTATVSGGALTVTGSLGTDIGTGAGASSNQLAVTGGVFSSTAGLIVGRAGSSNTFTVSNGGVATTGQARIGLLSSADSNFALVSGTGSQWTANGTVRVGAAGDNNTLGIDQGGVVTVSGPNRNLWIGYEGSSTGNEVWVKGAGSVLDVSGAGSEIVVSGTTTGSNKLSILNSGSVSASSVQIGPTGSLLFGSGGALPGTEQPGFLRADATINGNAGPGGTSLVAVSHTLANYVLPNVMSGRLDFLNFVDGKTTLTGSNTYTGETTLLSGTLALGPSASIASSGTISLETGASVLDVSAVSGGFHLASGQSLFGLGKVIGPVTADAGSTVAAGLGVSIGTLEMVGGFTLLGTLEVDVLGSQIDLIDGSSGVLTLGPSSSLIITSFLPDPSGLVLATYSSLVGTFGTVTGMPVGYYLDYNYLGGNQIAIAPIPEIDPAGMGSVVALLTGALGLFEQRRRRKRS